MVMVMVVMIVRRRVSRVNVEFCRITVVDTFLVSLVLLLSVWLENVQVTERAARITHSVLMVGAICIDSPV